MNVNRPQEFRSVNKQLSHVLLDSAVLSFCWSHSSEKKKNRLKRTLCDLTIFLLCLEPTVYCWQSKHYLTIKYNHFISLFCVCYWRVSGWNTIGSIYFLRWSKTVSTVMHMTSNRGILIFVIFYCVRHKRWHLFHIAAPLSCMFATAQSLFSY